MLLQEAFRFPRSHHIGFGFFNHFTQFPRLVHFNHDITATEELTCHIQLRYRRPVGILFDALTDLFVSQHVNGMEFNIETAQNLRGRIAETALWKELTALHEEQYRMLLNQGLNATSRVCDCNDAREQ